MWHPRDRLPSQSASKTHNQEKKVQKPLRASWVSPKLCPPCLIIIQYCYFDSRISKPLICSCWVISVSCSVHVISTYNVRKGSWAFYLVYPQINEVGQSDHRLNDPEWTLTCLFVFFFLGGGGDRTEHFNDWFSIELHRVGLSLLWQQIRRANKLEPP